MDLRKVSNLEYFMPHGNLNFFIKTSFSHLSCRLVMLENGKLKEMIGREKNKEEKAVL